MSEGASLTGMFFQRRARPDGYTSPYPVHTARSPHLTVSDLRGEAVDDDAAGYHAVVEQQPANRFVIVREHLCRTSSSQTTGRTTGRRISPLENSSPAVERGGPRSCVDHEPHLAAGRHFRLRRPEVVGHADNCRALALIRKLPSLDDRIAYAISRCWEREGFFRAMACFYDFAHELEPNDVYEVMALEALVRAGALDEAVARSWAIEQRPIVSGILLLTFASVLHRTADRAEVSQKTADLRAGDASG